MLSDILEDKEGLRIGETRVKCITFAGNKDGIGIKEYGMNINVEKTKVNAKSEKIQAVKYKYLRSMLTADWKSEIVANKDKNCRD